ncbi:hypothetical protein NXS98_06080 [Fontisphaera persica]|uniref:hypothetical protein n=1 Tax=Fontisphaera persica TaxID=2974023 RepID=UPI0024BFC25C|nr:hypothetical protein [Fontisphaera persica]WCJ60692.1 hypothetical protein NXS98_06080 [Fontisphaera persica]
MKAKAKKIQKAILAEGSYLAKLTSTKYRMNGSEATKVSLCFKIDGCEEEVIKELPFSLDEGTRLRQDVETLLGRQFTAKEAEDGYEIDNLIGKACQIVVAHESGAGGKSKPVVKVIMAAPQASLPINA